MFESLLISSQKQRGGRQQIWDDATLQFNWTDTAPLSSPMSSFMGQIFAGLSLFIFPRLSDCAAGWIAQARNIVSRSLCAHRIVSLQADRPNLVTQAVTVYWDYF